MNDFLHTLECVTWVIIAILLVAATLFFVGIVLLIAFQMSIYIGMGIVGTPLVLTIISLIVHILKKRRLKR